MKKILVTCALLAVLATPAYAITNPIDVPNNRIGVHILDTTELDQASKLVNSHGGDWGYVTIPMRSNDRDHDKWTAFFESARKLHVIPIVRLATYPEGGTWVSPDVFDLVDFANFLNDMPWPTKNRYVILFNEPNHAYEWGGKVNPFEYATLLLNARSIFKDRSDDFFLLSGGLDMSVPNSATSMDAFKFYQAMTTLQPDWYSAIDGLSVHAYPNPAFSSSPYSQTRYGISSYKHELKYLSQFGFTSKPVFITETGWPGTSDFFKPAFSDVWQDSYLVAITPFLLNAGSGDFAKFSLLSPSGLPKKTYQEIFDLPKISGGPLLSNVTFMPASGLKSTDQPAKGLVDNVTSFFNRLFHMTKTHTVTVQGTVVTVDLANTDALRQQGLSGRSTLAENTGMLFVFDKPGFYPFWMIDMQFPLDFLWIRNNKIVELTENVPQPKSGERPAIINPQQEADHVLEVPAGFIKSHALGLGGLLRLIDGIPVTF